MSCMAKPSDMSLDKLAYCPAQSRRKAQDAQPPPRAQETWGDKDSASCIGEEAQDEPKCCKLGTWSEILPLQGTEAAERVLGWGADVAELCL